MENLEELAGLDLEALDPTPNVHALFSYYNSLYFDNQLGACSVEWSTKRMTLCAGVCHFSRTGGCRIKLSEPLLKFRPVRDLKETLLHEMIHAALFLGNVRDDGDHGPKFRAIMTRINKATCPDSQRPPGGYNITVYHTMHDEVNNYRTHVWRCTACGNMVRRSMNRPPQEADCRSYSKTAAAAAPGGAYCLDARCWYHGHVRTCGGAYEKIAEPEKQPPPTKTGAASSSGNTGSKHPNAANKRRAAAAAGAPAITSFFPKRESGASQQQQQQQQDVSQQVPSLPSQQQQQQQSNSQMTGKGDAQQRHQQQEQKQAQPASSSETAGVHKPPDPRAAAAAAALARAGGSAAPAAGQPALLHGFGLRQWQQPQQQTPKQRLPSIQRQQTQPADGQSAAAAAATAAREPPAEVVELLSSDDEADAAPAAERQHCRTVSVAGTAVAAAVPLGAGQQTLAAATVAANAAGASRSVLMCPVCCLEFQELGALNAHLDECLL